MYENAKEGDYLYTDYTFGETATSYDQWIARCLAPASAETNNKSLWVSNAVAETWGNTGSDVAGIPNSSTDSDMNGVANTAVLVELGNSSSSSSYSLAKGIIRRYGEGWYLPAIGELKKYINKIKNLNVSSSYNINSSSEYSANNTWSIGLNNKTGKTYNTGPKYNSSTPGVGFCYLSGPINNPFTKIDIQFDWKDLFPKMQRPQNYHSVNGYTVDYKDLFIN